MNTLIVLLGPTGVGKTELSLQIAKQLRTPIINADSRQIYAEIPIGTAAPTLEQQSNIKHYFVGNLHINDYYSAAKYEEDVLHLLDSYFDDSHTVAFMSGGSMLYINAVCNGIDDIPTVNEETRESLKRELSEKGLPTLVEELKELDPEHYQMIDKNNPRRVVHALEICRMTGKTYSSFRKNTKKQRPFRMIKIGINRPREEMYERINARVLGMMDNGLLEEAQRVYPFRANNALNTVGFKELFEYFDGNVTLEKSIENIKTNSRRYAKRQITWFKRDLSYEYCFLNDDLLIR